MKLLNVGCGSNFHEDWVNIDMISTSPKVIGHDLRQGLPFGDASFDAVYCSHVLEHFTPSEGRKLVEEMLRVLKSGGVVRLVVPDLERIARLYLEKLEAALRSDPGAEADYDWILLEMYDQTVRSRSGGEMAAYLSRDTLPNPDFIASRIGLVEGASFKNASQAPRKSLLQKIAAKSPGWLVRRGRLEAARAAVSALAGRQALRSFDEGLFRDSGEIHRWMYDRFSLTRLLRSLGASEPRVCSAGQSQITSFDRYGLDAHAGAPRKPDSLFIEATKP